MISGAVGCMVGSYCFLTKAEKNQWGQSTTTNSYGLYTPTKRKQQATQVSCHAARQFRPDVTQENSPTSCHGVTASENSLRKSVSISV